MLLRALFNQLRHLFLALSFCFFAFSPAPLAAQETQDAHKAALERLSPLIGKFTVGGMRHTQEGKVPLPQSEAKVQKILNGYGLQESSEADMGMENPVRILTTFSYDPYRKLYRVSAMDDTFGLMDIYEGRFIEDGILAVTNLRSDTYFPMGDDGGRLHFMLRWTLNTPVKKFDVLMSTDGGASWAPYFEMTYTPVQ